MVIADLPGTILGRAQGNTITLDATAAGYGWSTTQFGQPVNQTAEDRSTARMDLLTTVMHELGHVLGFAHDETGPMQSTLTPGTQWLTDEMLEQLIDTGRLESEAVDALFAGE